MSAAEFVSVHDHRCDHAVALLLQLDVRKAPQREALRPAARPSTTTDCSAAQRQQLALIRLSTNVTTRNGGAERGHTCTLLDVVNCARHEVSARRAVLVLPPTPSTGAVRCA